MSLTIGVNQARVTRNPLRGQAPAAPATQSPLTFHRRMAGYAASPLFDLPDLARSLGVGRLLAKVEGSRLGLPSFKVLGASWATYHAVCDRLAIDAGADLTIGDLAGRLRQLPSLRLAAATDGNHGRAVAYMARQLGLPCDIFVPAGTAPARIDAIVGEGASVTIVDGTYDDTVARSAQESGPECLVIADTSWDGYTEVPRRVIEGYETIFTETDIALADGGIPQPDVIVVPVGVGALMAAAVTHYRSRSHGDAPTLIGVEPLDANCVQVSVEHGEVTQVPGPHRSIMVGLNCGIPSIVAWPTVSSGVDWFVAVHDDVARDAMRQLADAGIVAGETGAASLAGLAAFIDARRNHRDADQLSRATVLIIVTEGATDPENYQAIVGRPPDAVAQAVQPIAKVQTG